MRGFLLKQVAPGNPWEQGIYIVLGVVWIASVVGGHPTAADQPRWIFWVMVGVTPFAIVRCARGVMLRLDRRTQGSEK